MIDEKGCIDIVIPVYNEGENILRVLNAFEKQVNNPIRVLICYDFEDDSTLRALNSYSARKFEIIPVKNKGRFAHGAATTGFQFSDAPAVISYMADDDYNVGIIDQMIQKYQQGCDVVCASRFIPGGSMVGCRWQKALPVRLAAFTLNKVAGFAVHDPTNAFRFFSRRLLETVNIESTKGFTYSLELTAKAHRLGLKIGEVPANWYERKVGTSRFKVLVLR